jgi:hypothetical protein
MRDVHIEILRCAQDAIEDPVILRSAATKDLDACGNARLMCIAPRQMASASP